MKVNIFKKYVVFCFLLVFLGGMVISFSNGKCNDNTKPLSNNIHLVVSTDNNYVYPTVVTLTSLLENSDSTTFHNIYVLTSDDFSSENTEKILTLTGKYKNFDLSFKKIGTDFNEYKDYKYFTKAIFFRLKIPSILKNEKKCIYLDTDLIVLKDLLDLYKTDLKDNYLAGVKDGSGVSYKGMFINKIGMSEEVTQKYINSGVLVWNLEKIRQDNLESKFKDFVVEKVFKEKVSKFGDQDSLNAVCNGNILNLPLKYNLTIAIRPNLPYKNNFKANTSFTKEEWEEGINDPTIVHYTSSLKPWKRSGGFKHDLWWKYADKCPLKNEIGKNLGKYRVSE